MTAILVILVILGLAFIFVEFFIPGGVVGIIGGLFILAAIVTGYAFEGPMVGTLLLVASMVMGAILVPLWMKLFPNTPIGKSMTLSGSLPKGNGDNRPVLNLGTRGVTVTPLRPSGTVRFGADRIDVVSEGRMVESGVAVEVYKVDGTRIVVRPIEVPSEGSD